MATSEQSRVPAWKRQGSVPTQVRGEQGTEGPPQRQRWARGWEAREEPSA